MPRRQTQGAAAVLAEPESAVASAQVYAAHPGIYRPSAGLRRSLNRQVVLSKGSAKHEAQPDSPWAAGHAPLLVSLIGAGLAVGAVSGLLELLVQAIQLRVLHQVTWRTLVISRHSSWMAVLVATVLAPCLVALLMSPAIGWAARRKWQGAAAARLEWTWDLAGMILATLLVLGPIQTVHGLHPTASLARGAGRRGSSTAFDGSPNAGVAACRVLGGLHRGIIAAALHALAMARRHERTRASALRGRRHARACSGSSWTRFAPIT